MTAAIYLKDYQAPSHLIDKTQLRVELEEDSTLVTAHLQIRRNPAVNSMAPLILAGQNLELEAVAIDGEVLDSDRYRLDAGSLTLEDFNQGMIKIVTRIKPQENTSLEGLYKSSGKFCTQCEAEGFRKITYYLDRPDVMSEFTTTIVGDKTRYPVLLSNGNLIEQGELAGGKHFCTWHDPFPKPCYLFALVAGDLVAVEDQFVTCSGRAVTIKVFVEEKDSGKCSHAIDSLKRAMKWDEEVYGREYDLDIFMIVAVDDFNMGAMENKGLNIFNTSCVLAESEITTDAAFQRVEAVVAHEYFHNWSGNRVTCRDWFQLSLKEGFTVFRDACFSADMGSPVVKRIEDVVLLRTAQFAEDSGPMAHPVQPASYIEISNFYTLTIYEKGAEVVRMIHTLLGPELFRRGSDLYFQRHDGQAVTINEFVDAMETVSGRDLSQFKHWYTQAGTPVLTVNGDYDKHNQTYTLSIAQTCPPTPEATEKQPFHMPVAVGLVGADGEIQAEYNGQKSNEHLLELTAAEQQFVFSQVVVEPVPSLLRNFSAPVRLRYNYNRDELITLVRGDSDPFNRWEAMQQLAVDIIDDAVAAYPALENFVVDERLINALMEALDDTLLDPALLALLLQLPSEAYLSELSTCIPVDAIHHGRNAVRAALADALEQKLVGCYERTKAQSESDYQPNAEQVAKRSLKNTLLSYLVLSAPKRWLAECERQFADANNMTDCLAALTLLVRHGTTTMAQQSLATFYQRWQSEPLVVNQWLIVQAAAPAADALARVKALMQHPCFEMTNPNKVRSLIGTFCAQNLVSFHAPDGSGYEFLTDQVIELNRLNPQIASRLLTPLTRWRKYDETRQQQMRKMLCRIRDLDNLSKDVFEIVSKSLAEQE